MKTYTGSGQISAEGGVLEITLLVFDKTIHIGHHTPLGLPAILQWNIKDVRASFDTISQTTRIHNSKHSPIEIFIKGEDAAQYIHAMQAEYDKPWYQTSKVKGWRRNTLILLGAATLLVILYFLFVPWLSAKMASTVSVQTEERFGEAIYDALGIDDSEDTAASSAINTFFAAMKLKTAYNIRIAVVNGETINAFALPGGRIVIYKALLQQMETYPELAALLSHEFTHINNKHSTKSIFRKLGSEIFIGLLFGKFGSVTSVLADHADNLKSLIYSRRLEKEADMEGLSLLKQQKIDPAGFEHLFLHLKQTAPSTFIPEFLASHPDIDQRTTYIREASAGAVIEENIQLKTIFENLKQNIHQ